MQDVLKYYAEHGNQCGPNLSYQIRLKLAKIIIKTINGIDPKLERRVPC